MADRGPAGNDKPARLQPLHGGRHNLPPDVVAFNQRERLIAALAEVVAEHGYNRTTIAQITDAASVSRRTFYENFASKEECFFAAYDAVVAYIQKLVGEVVKGQTTWPDRVAASLAELLRFLAGRPQLARVCLVESAAVGEGMASRRAESAGLFIEMLSAGRPSRAGDRELADGIEEALVGGVITLLGRRTLAGEAEQLERFIPGVIEFALAPYIGFEEARELAGRYS